MAELLTSVHNPKIKKLLALQQKSSERRESGLFVVEGIRELQHCLEAGYEIDSLFVSASCNGAEGLPVSNAFRDPLNGLASCDGTEVLPMPNSLKDPLNGLAGCDGSLSELGVGKPRPRPKWRTFNVTPEVYEKIAYRGSTEGVIAEVRSKEMHLNGLKLKENPLIVVLESVEKPGNLGAVLRSADAAGADAVIVCDPLTDLYNPNLIRASLGGIFSVPTVACTSEEAIKWLKGNDIQILTAQLQDSSYYYDTDMKRGTAIVMGTEATGLTDAWRKAADAHILIPMLGRLDSLNVSASAAILLFEAVRQRRQI